MSKTYEGYLLIADITGYTSYLNESELEHAQETLTALLEVLVENTRSPLVISRLAGDAVISYGLRENFFMAQTFIEKIEETYITFRKAIERLVLNNTCQCNACANISTLDLKFFVHYGVFGLQQISEYDELVGTDINLLHRLLKNNITEEIGFQAYALYTETAIQQLGAEAIGETMTPHTEAYEHLGEVAVLVQDMHPVWEKKRDETAVVFPIDRLLDRSEILINLTPERVWDYMTQPVFRKTLIGADRIDIANREQGRVAPGSVYQCYHGDKWVPQIILEWIPFKSMITRESHNMFRDLNAILEHRLEPTNSGTKLIKLFARPTGPFLGRMMIILLAPVFRRFIMRDLEAFKLEIETDYQAQSIAQQT